MSGVSASPARPYRNSAPPPTAAYAYWAVNGDCACAGAATAAETTIASSAQRRTGRLGTGGFSVSRGKQVNGMRFPRAERDGAAQ